MKRFVQHNSDVLDYLSQLFYLQCTYTVNAQCVSDLKGNERYVTQT